MDVVSVAISEELREIAATSIGEEALLCIEIAANHIRDRHSSTLFEFHISILACTCDASLEIHASFGPHVKYTPLIFLPPAMVYVSSGSSSGSTIVF